MYIHKHRRGEGRTAVASNEKVTPKHNDDEDDDGSIWFTKIILYIIYIIRYRVMIMP